MSKLLSVFCALIIGLSTVILGVNWIRFARATDAYKSGESYARSLQNQVQGAASQNSLANVPQFKSGDPPQTQLQDQNMGEAAKRRLASEESAQAVMESNAVRGKFTIDLVHDPLMIRSNEMIADPLQIIADGEVLETQTTPMSPPELLTCEESGDPATYTCLENRVVRVTAPAAKTHKLTVHVYSHGWGGGLGRNVITGRKLDSASETTNQYAAGTKAYPLLDLELQSRVKSVKLLNFANGASLNENGDFWVSTGGGGGWNWLNHVDYEVEITYKPILKDSDVQEHVDGACAGLELKAEQGLCEYISQEITQGPQIRTFNGHDVAREWWQRRLTYHCSSPSTKDCGPLKARGCRQVDSTCKQMIGGACILWLQTYQCESSTRHAAGKAITGQGTPFCLGGDCASQTYEANNEMLDAIAKLSVFKEVQDNIKGGIKEIFKGGDKRCRKNCAGFKDCCKSLKGWGVSAGVAGCSADEKLLAQQKDKKLCHQVGTYCDQKKFGICVVKKTSYCCFPSKLSRMIHEQGRAQLGIDWGQPNQPQCRGLSVQELSRIDFSRLDMSELYQDVMANYHAPDLNKLRQSVSERLDQLQTSLKGAQTPQALPEHLRKMRKDGL